MTKQSIKQPTTQPTTNQQASSLTHLDQQDDVAMVDVAPKPSPAAAPAPAPLSNYRKPAARC